VNTTKKELISYLSNLISDNRKEKFNEVLHCRTRYISVVLEDIYQPHNASAVLRSCDIFGVQDIHIIENRNTYTVNPDIALGSAKWLSLHKYKNNDNNTLTCLKSLKEKGYRIVATSPYEKYPTLDELSIEQPIALVFGTELTGISDTIVKHADEFVRIPMYGFTESFNISVCAALCLHTLINKLHKSDKSWKLNDDEKDEILLQWLKKTIKKADIIEKNFMRGFI
jgi:tRNA (guanosine-2'-O-)-methyltransferase